MSPNEAADLAARILAAIDRNDAPTGSQSVADHCREQVASDLAGLQQHAPDPKALTACEFCTGDGCYGPSPWPCPDAARYADGLLRTAALYGVTP